MMNSSKFLVGLAIGLLMITKCCSMKLGTTTGKASVRFNGQDVPPMEAPVVIDGGSIMVDDLKLGRDGGQVPASGGGLGPTIERAPPIVAPEGQPICEKGTEFYGVAIEKNVLLGNGVKLGEGSTLEDDVQIGENSELKGVLYIEPHVRIGKRTKMGDGTRVLEGVTVGDDVTVGEGVTIGPKAVVHDGATLMDRAVVGYRSNIGKNTKLYPKVLVKANVIIGNNSKIHSKEVGSGTKIGDGTKVNSTEEIAEKVTLGNNVEVHVGALFGTGVTVLDNLHVFPRANVLSFEVVKTDVGEGERVLNAKTQERHRIEERRRQGRSRSRSRSPKRSLIEVPGNDVQTILQRSNPPKKGKLDKPEAKRD